MASKATSSIEDRHIRDDFPILKREVRPGIPLIYLDSAATSQKPIPVLEAMDRYYREINANIHRGIHALAEEATEAYESARRRIAAFINAPSSEELIFTRNTTESINLVANTWGRKYLQAGDLVLLTEMEHHSNLVPWQLLAEQLDLRLEFIPVTSQGLLDLDQYQRLLSLEPKLVSLTHMSNVLGTINPLEEILPAAKAAGAVTLVDGAQSVPHFPVDLSQLQADFYAFSAHKMLGPTGIGALYGKKELLESMPPFLGGGEMIKRVELRSFTANDLPHKFEAGTPAIAEAIGFGAAVDYLTGIGMSEIEKQEKRITGYALERLSMIPELEILGPGIEEKGGVISFAVKGIHAHDVAQVLDSVGIAVRAGHHCAQPLHTRYDLPATSRASFYLYNTEDEVDRLVEGIDKAKAIFA
ncbi:MAG: cysteine desulfurase [Anaerolineales bacterium]|jgi:cysteine desulfurase/selenocysteine lyase